MQKVALRSIAMNRPKFSDTRPRQTLSDFLSQASEQWPKPQSFDQTLLKTAIVFVLMGTLLLSINGLQTGFFTLQMLSKMLPAIIWEHLSFMGDTLVMLTLALLLAYRYPHLLFALLLTALVGTLITHGIKFWLMTPRPPAVLEPGTFQLIGSSITKKSMPSGHTLTAFAAAGLLTRLTTNHAYQWLILIAAAFIGWSRVAVGVHWPADVCMGAAGGLLSAWIGLKLADRWLPIFGKGFFLTLLSIHIGCAIALTSYDGGFPHTWIFAVAASAISLAILYQSFSAGQLLPTFNLRRR